MINILFWFCVLVFFAEILRLLAVNLFSSGLILFVSGYKFRWSFHIPASLLVSFFLGALLVFASFEEINWGQHYLRFDTPEFIENLNVQEEFNVHNLGSYWANNVMMVFFLCYVGFLPLLSYGFQDIRYLVDRLAVPLPSLFFVPYGFIGPLLDEHNSFNWIWGSPPWRLSEAREALFSFVMLCIALEIFLKWRKDS
jgi:energy-coupling factor transporter transmembrane protein EcfT